MQAPDFLLPLKFVHLDYWRRSPLSSIKWSDQVILLAKKNADRVFADWARGNQSLQAHFAALGPQITAALLLSMLGPSPLVRVHKAACIMAGLARLPGSSPQAACQWLQAALGLCGGLFFPCIAIAFHWIDGTPNLQFPSCLVGTSDKCFAVLLSA